MKHLHDDDQHMSERSWWLLALLVWLAVLLALMYA